MHAENETTMDGRSEADGTKTADADPEAPNVDHLNQENDDAHGTDFKDMAEEGQEGTGSPERDVLPTEPDLGSARVKLSPEVRRRKNLSIR